MATTTPDKSRPAVGPHATAVELYYRAFFSDPILNAFYGDSGYANLGHWSSETCDAAAAGDRLVDQLIQRIPNPAGSILDVACGRGGSTHRLQSYFTAENITAIGASRAQLREARERVPGATFVEMDASALEFPDESFDNVLCMEAAFHFDTRERFLAEAHRVLRPGGHLVLSDLLMTRGTPMVPPQNHLSDATAYRALLQELDFDEIQTVDATGETWHAFRRRFTSFVLHGSPEWGAWLKTRDLLAANWSCAWAIRSCLLISARKPAASSAQRIAGGGGSR